MLKTGCSFEKRRIESKAMSSRAFVLCLPFTAAMGTSPTLERWTARESGEGEFGTPCHVSEGG